MVGRMRCVPVLYLHVFMCWSYFSSVARVRRRLAIPVVSRPVLRCSPLPLHGLSSSSFSCRSPLLWFLSYFPQQGMLVPRHVSCVMITNFIRRDSYSLVCVFFDRRPLAVVGSRCRQRHSYSYLSSLGSIRSDVK